jgi:hypothetical protein
MMKCLAFLSAILVLISACSGGGSGGNGSDPGAEPNSVDSTTKHTFTNYSDVTKQKESGHGMIRTITHKIDYLNSKGLQNFVIDTRIGVNGPTSMTIDSKAQPTCTSGLINVSYQLFKKGSDRGEVDEERDVEIPFHMGGQVYFPKGGFYFVRTTVDVQGACTALIMDVTAVQEIYF